jgi:opacity protein-like surface antigen
MMSPTSVRLVRAACVAACVLTLSLLLPAQTTNTTTPPEQRITFNAGGGFTSPTGKIGDDLNRGWNVTAGAGLNATPMFSLGLQYLYNGFGIPTAVANQFGATAADAHIWALTVNPTLKLSTFHAVQPYLVGGVGYYRRTSETTEPALVTTTGVTPFAVVNVTQPANVVTSTHSRSSIGGNAGLGFAFGVGHNVYGTTPQIFVEARYHYAPTAQFPIRMIPVTFGIRF